jgi:hypothetical protein
MPALQWLDERLAEQGTTVDELVELELQSQGAANVTVRNVITSMRFMSVFDWESFFESVSLVTETLRGGAEFSAMDFRTRDRYRHAIEELARGSGRSELEASAEAVRACVRGVRPWKGCRCGWVGAEHADRRTNMNLLTAIHGVSRLAFDAIDQTTRIVEGMHANIAAAPPPFGRSTNESTHGITGMVYGGIRLVNGAVRAALDPPLRLLAQLASDPASPNLPEPQWDAVRSAVNGVLGDHLVATDNPLAIPMRLRRAGRPLSLEDERLTLPEATARCWFSSTACA